MLVLALNIAMFITGYLCWPVSRGHKVTRALLCLLSAASIVIWLLFPAYFLHILDRSWYFEWRSRSETDLLAGTVGFAVGCAAAMARLRLLSDETSKYSAVRSAAIYATLSISLSVLAFAKPWITPAAQSSWPAIWKDGVCMQRTVSTCGPCSAATLLRELGYTASERDLSIESQATISGTLNWLLVRALRTRGFTVKYASPQNIDEVIPISIVGVTMPGGAGHFITYLGRDGEHYVIGDPLAGRLRLTSAELVRRYRFDGFAISVRR